MNKQCGSFCLRGLVLGRMMSVLIVLMQVLVCILVLVLVLLFLMILVLLVMVLVLLLLMVLVLVLLLLMNAGVPVADGVGLDVCNDDGVFITCPISKTFSL